jgi:polyphosphate kinase
MKDNALVDPAIIDMLYAARARAWRRSAVQTAACAGPAGTFDNIRSNRSDAPLRTAVSLFGSSWPAAPYAAVYISSADIMPRKLDCRVEVPALILNLTA